MNTFPRWDEPISIDSPEGVNIEYDSRFLELQSVAEGKPEQQLCTSSYCQTWTRRVLRWLRSN